MITKEDITIGRKITWLNYYNGKMCRFRGRIISVAANLLEFGFKAEGQEEISRKHVITILYVDDNSVNTD